MKSLLKLLLPILVLAVGVGVFQYLKLTRPERPPTEIRERIWRVEVETLTPARLAPVLELHGRVEHPGLWRAAAPAPARVARVLAREGERVTRGQLLLELDPRDFTLRLAQAAARVSELQALLESERNRRAADQDALVQERELLRIAEDGVERARSLSVRQAGSRTDLDLALQDRARQALAVSNRTQDLADFPARERALQARLQNAEAARDELLLQFERSRILAPQDAILSAVAVAPGDQVKTDEVLLRLYDLASLEVRARIPASFQAEIAAALAAGVRLPAVARVGSARIELELTRLAGEAAASGLDGLFRVLSAPDAPRVGQMLSLRLERPAVPDAAAVPFAAVYGGDRIYILADGRMRGVRVETLGAWFSDAGEERLLVRAADLKAGDRLILTHMPNAIEGLRVEVAE